MKREFKLIIPPTLNPEYLTEVFMAFEDNLQGLAYRMCELLDIPDFKQDAVAISFSKVIGADLVIENKEGIHHFLKTIVRGACIDEFRYRTKWELVGQWVSDYEDDEVGVMKEPEDEKKDVEGAAYSVMCLKHLSEALEYIPKNVSKRYTRLITDLEDFLSLDPETEVYQPDGRTRRGRVMALLKGWIHRKYGTMPSSSRSTEPWWMLGFELADRFLQENEETCEEKL